MSTPADNIAKALGLKEEGNEHFKAGDYRKAIAAYHQIFLYVHGYSQGSGGQAMPGQTTTPVTADEMEQIKELKLAHFCNLAMCHLKAQPPNWQKARANCTKALELEPTSVKALFRRGKCNAQLGHLDEAKEDLERVMQLQPDNKDANRELRALKPLFDKQRKKEQKKFAGMFDKMHADDEAAAPAAPSGADSAAAVPPAAGEGGGVGAAGDGDDDEDIGDPLGAPQAFEPKDVLYKGEAPPVRVD